ncbi:MAG TPA: S53 family peptidase [Flexivirga sp.]|uniref:S53 family peptidase n=1 Tax=Flexivirga sp. TaxID=1962927 RepID=UPI002B6797B4|nr:S53 family peptidase [Flexivirga sp.]HWC23166.1 S53 family peptidase [Flexivirga sp.]
MAHAAGNGSDTVRLTNSGRTALPDHSNLRTLGVADNTTNVDLSIAVPLRNQALLDSLLAKGTVISPAQYKRLFGASPASLKKVADWAKGEGLKVTAKDAAAGVVTVAAPVRTINKAFSLKMERVALGSRTGLAPNNDPQLPKSLGVVNVAGLTTVSSRHTGPIDTFGPERPLKSAPRSTDRTNSPFSNSRSMPGTKATAAAVSNDCASYWGENVAVSASKFSSTSNMMCGYSPQQAVRMYNAGGASKVKANIGILLWCADKDAKAKANAVSDYYKYPELATYNDQSAPENAQDCAGGDAYGEQNMDIQTSHYMSPQSAITYYGASGPTDSALLSIFNKAVTQHTVTTLSMSWGGDESGQTTSFKQQFDRTAARASVTGISLFASSGDMGDGSIVEGGTAPSRSKEPSYPATSPFFTAVGGTAAALNASGGRQFTVGWSTSLWDQPSKSSTTGITRYPYFGNSVGAGGGVSRDYAQPAWQKGVVTGSTTKRTIPDVSAIADPATGLGLTFDGLNLTTSGGTSQSSPLVAALVASSKALTGRQVGNAAPYFYKLKGTTNITDVKAVTAGKYGMVFGQDSKTGHYVLEGLAQPSDSLRVATGWDNVTGLGEPSGSFLTSFGK